MASPLYETAAGHRRMDPVWARSLKRVQAWKTKPEPCHACRTAVSTTLMGDDTALCGTCAPSHVSLRDKLKARARANTPEMMRTRARHERMRALLASIEVDDKPKPKTGLIGLAVPFGVPTKIGRNHWEVFERGAFEETIIPIRKGHDGEPVSLGRAFPTRHGLCFDADMAQPDALAKWAKGVSIGFRYNKADCTIEPYEGGTLARFRKARLTEIALVGGNQTPAYRAAWCFPRSDAGWKRLYGPMQSEIKAIIRGDQ